MAVAVAVAVGVAVSVGVSVAVAVSVAVGVAVSVGSGVAVSSAWQSSAMRLWIRSIQSCRFCLSLGSTARGSWSIWRSAERICARASLRSASVQAA